MLDIYLTVDSSGVEKAVKQLRKMLAEVSTMGRILQYAASAIWVPNIEDRLLSNITTTSGYRQFLDQALSNLDPDFVARLGNASGWADRSEAERRGYNPGEITEKISEAIKASIPVKTPGIIAVGIGNINLLNGLLNHVTGESKYKIWQILQWGTGEYVPGGSAVIRTGKQVFFESKEQRGVLIEEGNPLADKEFTKNPGFKGREYFVQIDGSIHESDYVSRDYVLRYMRKIIKKYSYK